MTQFNPLTASDELKKLYKSFILSSFPVKNLSLRSKLEDAIDNEKLLWNGPFTTAR